MEMVYVDRSASRVSEMMISKASVDPKLIKHRTPDKTDVKYTELKGI